MKKARRILVLSFYYPPDLAAGSFRTIALVDALLEDKSSEIKIDIVTTRPNRYGSFSSKAPAHEHFGRHSIYRIELPPHQSGMVDQTRAFARYWRAASKLVKGNQYDLVYATSSRLMTAALGAWVAKRADTKLYLDIRDIFADTIKDVLPKRMTFILKPVFSGIEGWTVNRAAHVNLVSRGFEPYFNAKYPSQSFSYFTNGIDQEFLTARANADRRGPHNNDRIRVVYAGNMGEGQGLHAIIPALARRLESRATFRLIGDGGRRSRLEQSLAETGTTNVEVVPPMAREALIKEYLAADVLFLHLNDYEAFKKVLPSKIFEYAALGKPIWAGVSGHAAQFIRQEVPNAAVFRPCDVEEAIRVFGELNIRDATRNAFVEKYSRNGIMRAMAAHLLGVLETEAKL